MRVCQPMAIAIRRVDDAAQRGDLGQREVKALAATPAPFTRQAIIDVNRLILVVIMCLLPTWRDIQCAPRARGAIVADIVLEFIVNAGANQPHGTLADIATKHGQVPLIIHTATDSSREGHRAGHDVIRRNIRLVWLNAGD